MLCLRKGRDDPKDLEGVLSVLDRRLYDGGDGGVVFHTGLGPEASADLEFGLGRPECLLAVVVRGRDIRVREEGEDVVPVLGDALFEFVQLGVLPVFPRVDGRSGEQLVQTFIHPDIPHEVGGPAVGHPDRPAQLLRREVPVDDTMSPALVKGKVRRRRPPSRPRPFVLSSRMASWRACAWHSVCWTRFPR
mgnify:CR=1 FL=1